MTRYSLLTGQTPTLVSCTLYNVCYDNIVPGPEKRRAKTKQVYSTHRKEVEAWVEGAKCYLRNLVEEPIGGLIVCDKEYPEVR